MAVWDMFDSFFHPERGYKDAGDIFKKFWEESRNREQPFVNQGQQMWPGLYGAYGDLLNGNMMKKWMENYKESPYAQQSRANATEAGMNAASQQGLLGSSAATQNIQNSSDYIMNKDRSDYLDRMMQQYQLGVGLGKDVYGMGANMAGEMGRQGLEWGRDIGGAAGNEANAPGHLLGYLLKMYVDSQGNISNGMGKAGMGAATGGTSSIAA